MATPRKTTMTKAELRDFRRRNIAKYKELSVFNSAKSRLTYAAVGTDPLVVEMAKILKAYPAFERDVCRRAGVGVRVPWMWRTKASSPTLGNFRAILEAMGHTLKIVEIGHED